MAISIADIKLLWSRASGRCSLCHDKVTEDTSGGSSFPVGEQAHIVAKSPDGPRGDSQLTPDERDSYENLILLCASCHGRVDKNVVDFPADVLHFRKRQHERRMEVAGERAIQEGLLPHFDPDGRPDERRFKAVRVDEDKQDLFPGDPIRSRAAWYEVHVQYPEFFAEGCPALAEVNRVVAGDVTRWVHSMRHRGISESGTGYTGAAELRGGFKVRMLSARYVSFDMECLQVEGGAHGDFEQRTYTFLLSPCIPLGVRDLFRDFDRAGAVLSTLARTALKEQHPSLQRDGWVEKGTPANLTEYSKFNLSPDGLVLHFEPYRVDCWAAGPYEAVIPYSRLASVLKPEFGGAREGW